MWWVMRRLGAARGKQDRKLLPLRSRQGSIAVRAPLPFDTAVIIVGGIRELMVIAEQQGRDIRTVTEAAAAAATAIVRQAVLGGVAVR